MPPLSALAPSRLSPPEAIERLWNPLVDVDFDLSDDDQLD